MPLNLQAKYLLLTIATGLVMGYASTANEPVHVAYGKVLAVGHRLAVTQQPNLAGAAVSGWPVAQLATSLVRVTAKPP